MILLKLCQIVVCTYLHADVTSIIYQHKDVTKMKILQMPDIRLLLISYQINFGEDKTKCNLAELNIKYDNNRLKQFHMEEYLCCHL